MNTKSNILLIVILMIAIVSFSYGQDSSSQKQNNSSNLSKQDGQKLHKRNFVDKNGDGYNDNAPDHDGDGIPNGLDQDYIKLKQQRNKGKLPYIDLDGDGINDNLKFGKKYRNRNNFHNNNLQPQKANSGNSAGVGKGEQKQNGKNKK